MRSIWLPILGSLLVGTVQAQPHLSLAQALQTGLETNLNLQRERLGLRLSQEDVVIAEAVWDPILRANYSYQNRLSPQASSVLDGASQPQTTNQNYGLSVSKALPTGATVSVAGSQSRSTTNSSNALLNPNFFSDLGAEVRQPLLKGAGLRVNLAPIARAQLRGKLSESTWQSSLINWMGSLEKAYWAVAAQQSLLEVRQAGLNLAEQLLEETEQRRVLGLGTDVALLQAEAEKAREEEALWVAQSTLADLWDDLVGLMGVDYQPEMLIPQLDDLPERLEGLPDYQEYWYRVLQKNGDLLESLWEIELAELEVLRAENQSLPAVDWVLGYEWLGREDEMVGSFDNALDRDGRTWNTGISVSIPWGRKADRARLRKARWSQQQAELNADILQRSLQERARQRWRAIALVQQRVDSVQAQLALREKAYEQANARYEAGLETFRDVLTAQRELQAARNGQVQVLVNQLTALIDVQQLDRSLLQRHGYTWDELPGSMAE